MIDLLITLAMSDPVLLDRPWQSDVPRAGEALD